MSKPRNIRKKRVCEVKLYRIRKNGKDYWITCCSDNPVVVKLIFTMLWVMGDLELQQVAYLNGFRVEKIEG